MAVSLIGLAQMVETISPELGRGRVWPKGADNVATADRAALAEVMADLLKNRMDAQTRLDPQNTIPQVRVLAVSSKGLKIRASLNFMAVEFDLLLG